MKIAINEIPFSNGRYYYYASKISQMDTIKTVFVTDHPHTHAYYLSRVKLIFQEVVLDPPSLVVRYGKACVEVYNLSKYLFCWARLQIDVLGGGELKLATNIKHCKCL